MKRNKFLAVNLILLCLLSFDAFAQTENGASNVQLLYAPTTPDYLAKSNFMLKELDENNNTIIDQYLLVTECDLYRQYYTNDIEWSKIREATRGYIRTNKKLFPNRFEFVQPIYLGRYDVPSHSFEILDNSKLMGVGIMQVSGNYASDYKCLKTSDYNPKIFPLNAVLNLSRPLNYTSVKASQESAEEYLKFLADNNIDNSLGRPAYVRYRFKVEQSLNPVSLDNGISANFFGGLESMTVFGDKGLFIKLEDVKY